MSHLRRHSLWDLKTKDLEVDENWVLNTPKRRKSDAFHNLSFGHYDEAGIEKVDNLEHVPESDSEAEFTDSEDEYSLAGSESNDSERLGPEFVYLKTLLCTDLNDDLVDWETFSNGMRQMDPDFFTGQLVSVFKDVSPEKQPVAFSEFVTFFQNPCDDVLIEFHRKQMYNSIMKSYKADKHSPDQVSPESVENEEISEEETDFEDESLETLRQRCKEQNDRIQELEVELESQRVENLSVSDRCRHLEKKITMLKDGEKLHTHVILLRAMIRNGEDVKSKRLRIMPAGATVRICEIRGNRARLDFPIKGWCSVFAQDGRPILQTLNSAEEIVPSPSLFMERQESESENLTPIAKRGHEESRQKQESDDEDLDALMWRIRDLESALEELTDSKIELVHNTSAEITRLTDLIVE